MADFEIAVTKTIANEGGDKYTEIDGDRGGATKYGISFKFLEHQLEVSLDKSLLNIGLKYLVDDITPSKDTVKNLTLEQAKYIYKKYFWTANRYGEINDQAIAEKVFDMAVLMGAPKANKILQYVYYCGDVSYIKFVDGIIGDKTLKRLNSPMKDLLRLMQYLQFYYMKYFISICNKDKTQSKFLFGWLNRVIS